MKTNDLKKGDMVIINAFDKNVQARIEDNRKGNARYCYVFGSQIGMTDEYGSVYSYNILFKLEGKTKIKIEHTKKNLVPKEIDSIFGHSKLIESEEELVKIFGL